MWIPDHLTCLLRNLYEGQEATVRTEQVTTDCSKSGKEYIKAIYCHPAYLTYMQSTSCEMPGWRKHKLKSRLLGEISITSGPSHYTLTFHFHALEKEMATHSSVLAWRIPGTGEPGGLLSMGSHRVWHDWSDLAAAAYMQKTPPLWQKVKKN